MGKRKEQQQQNNGTPEFYSTYKEHKELSEYETSKFEVFSFFQADVTINNTATVNNPSVSSTA